MIEIKTTVLGLNRLPKIKMFILIIMTMSISTVFMIFFRKQDLFQTTSYMFRGENNFASTRLVWPEQLPYSDRIKEQMYFVPKDYRYVMTPYKRILIQNGIGAEWEILKSEQGEFIGCPILILFNTESPHYSSSISDANVFNWTANYSGVPRPYGYLMKNNFLEPRDEENNYALHKTKKVAWFVSNCNPNSNRTMYANELGKHITFDVYGGYGKNKCPKTKEAECLKMLKNDYKFYLSFENSHCGYYVTEKLFVNALSNDVIPIVMGPKRSDYELMTPENLFIHVDDFHLPKELDDYLHLLDKDHQLYNKYFQWKGSGTVIRDTRFYYRLCAMLHDTKRAPKHYEGVNKWWRGLGICQS